LHKQKIIGKTVTLKVKYHNFVSITRSHTLGEAMAEKDKVMQTLQMLMQRTEAGNKPIRLIGLSIAGLSLEAQESGIKQQMGLFK